jgi:hypothetical protein
MAFKMKRFSEAPFQGGTKYVLLCGAAGTVLFVALCLLSWSLKFSLHSLWQWQIEVPDLRGMLMTMAVLGFFMGTLWPYFTCDLGRSDKCQRVSFVASLLAFSLILDVVWSEPESLDFLWHLVWQVTPVFAAAAVMFFVRRLVR